jgi:negative regulator of sigma E activity
VLAAVVTKTSKPEYVDELVRSAFAASVASAVVLKLDPLVSTSTTAKSESATPATLTNAVPKILAEPNNATGRTARARKPNKHLRNLLFILITE